MRLLLLLALNLALRCAIVAQNNAAQFRVVQIPSEIALAHPNIKTHLNDRIAQFKTRKQVFQLLNDSLRSFKNALVKIREQVSPSSFQYYDYFISAPAERGLLFVDIKGSRGEESEKIYQKFQLKQFFADTTAIIDTLAVTIIPADFNFKNNGYYIIAGAQAGQTIRLPANGNTVMVTQNLFTGIHDRYIACRFFSDQQPGKEISHFTLVFLDAGQKETLKNIGLLLKSENSYNRSFTEQEMAQHLSAYIDASWGVVKKTNLLNWIRQNL